MFTGQHINPSVSVASGAGYSGVSYGTATEAPPAMGRVSEAHQASQKLAEGILMEIQGLEQRLAQALRPQSPQVAGADSNKRNEPSSLAASVEALNERLYQVLSYLQSLSARVDL